MTKFLLKTQETLISQIKEKYGDLLDCSLIEYKGTHKNIKLKCNCCHNVFEKSPHNILYQNTIKTICPYCYKENMNKYYKETFIKKAKIIHNNKYDYSKITEYKNSKTKVPIICPEHGEFWQIPNSHLNGHGCPYCMRDKSRLKYEDFVKKSKIIHNDYYIYKDNIQYKNNQTLIPIICPIHGEFIQTAKTHLNGCGCPKCNQSWMEREICDLFEKNNIKYEQEKKFEWLKRDNYNLSLDFYLPDYNIAIECQGEQHFKPIDFYGGEERFKRVLENDLLKLKLCNEHSITLLHKSNVKNCNSKIKNRWKYYNIFIDNEKLIEIIMNQTIKSENEK